MSDSKCLLPPFAQSNGLSVPEPLVPPAFRVGNELYTTTAHMDDFLRRDLLTPKLGRIHRFLWLAGLPRPPRPLHRQRLLGRQIYATENPDEHLVWHGNRIFIKPLPEYLLNNVFWMKHIAVDRSLHQSACGLMLSYIWLVSNRNDLRIAIEAGLMPEAMEWKTWAALVLDVLNRIDTKSLRQVDRRYLYGELRLTRLNSLYRFGVGGFSLFTLVHGFMMGSERYDTFFQRNFGWILALLLYVTVVLSAIQVALATDGLKDDMHFQLLSYIITVVSLCLVAVAVAVMLLLWSGLFAFHLLTTLKFCKSEEAERLKCSA